MFPTHKYVPSNIFLEQTLTSCSLSDSWK